MTGISSNIPINDISGDQDAMNHGSSDASSSAHVAIRVNGEEQTCPIQTNLPTLLQQLGLNPRLVAVEYNGEILHRQFWDTTEMQNDDRLEIVTIVGGG